MESKCEYSSMQIPGDPKYATAAASYVCEIARMIGMQKQDIKSLEKGIIGAIKALIGYSFEAGEKGILACRIKDCRLAPSGLNCPQAKAR